MEIIKLHPIVVHFGLSSVVFLLLLDVYYRFAKRPLDNLHAYATYLTFILLLLTTLSGYISYEPIEDKLYQIEVFKTHKYLGILAPVIFLVVVFFRYMSSRSLLYRNLFTLWLALFVLYIMYQGGLGGTIVYEHMIKPWLEK